MADITPITIHGDDRGNQPRVIKAVMIDNISATTPAVSVSALDVSRLDDISIQIIGATTAAFGASIQMMGSLDGTNYENLGSEVAADSILNMGGVSVVHKIKATISKFTQTGEGITVIALGRRNRNV